MTLGRCHVVIRLDRYANNLPYLVGDQLISPFITVAVIMTICKKLISRSSNIKLHHINCEWKTSAVMMSDQRWRDIPRVARRPSDPGIQLRRWGWAMARARADLLPFTPPFDLRSKDSIVKILGRQLTCIVRDSIHIPAIGKGLMI